MNITANQLYFNYGRDHVLQNIQFQMNEPKIYGLLGRNGAGKTTLLSIIASFREPTAGELLINGKIPFENAEIMQQVTFMYSKDYSNESDHAKALMKGIAQYRPNFDADYAQELVKKFKLDIKKPVYKLSRGKQAAFNVIVGLASRTPITIFDEVYLGMDAPARDIFYKELIAEQERHPRIIILSTHLVSEMDYLFDDVIIINEGQIMLHESYDELISRGITLIGKREIIESFTSCKDMIHQEQLGDTHSVSLYGPINEEEITQAKEAGLQVNQISLNDLFIQLTKEGELDE